MKNFFHKYDLQLLAIIGAMTGILLLLALITSYEEGQRFFSALDNLSAGF
tara:strand:- start:2013 stop:2162 length:150 start_codon:yes stop_codon:yes gene_type:complete